MRTFTLVLPLILAAALQSAAPIVEPGFTSLFNGKDFTGWKISGPAESFSIQDGAIVAKGAASHAYYDGSVRNHAFRDFELKVDVMTRAGSNGGVYILTELQDPSAGNVRASGRFPSKGFEIQVNNSHTDRARTGSLYHVTDLLDDSPAKDDEWFTEHIIGRSCSGRSRPTGMADGKGPAGASPDRARSRCRRTTRTAPCTTGTSASSRSTDARPMRMPLRSQRPGRTAMLTGIFVSPPPHDGTENSKLYVPRNGGPGIQ